LHGSAVAELITARSENLLSFPSVAQAGAQRQMAPGYSCRRWSAAGTLT
jgi:hypothetical protein